jgi:hypothetical protein
LAFAEKGGYQFGKLTRGAVFEMHGFENCTGRSPLRWESAKWESTFLNRPLARC